MDYYYDNQGLPANKPPNFTPANSTGRLTAACYGGTTSSAGNYQSYDRLGRVTSSYQQTDLNNYGFSYGYNLSGAMSVETYPSGRQLTTEYDTAGRLAGVKKDATTYYAGGGANDATNRIQYAPQGAVSLMRLGNGTWEHTLFNARLQPTEIGLGASGASDLLKLQYTYSTAGQTNNNGNVRTQTITAPKTASGNLVLTQNYTYDALNRLSFAEELISTTSQWKQTYDIDRWGNRAVRNDINYTTYIPNPSLTPQSANSTDFSAFDQTTNRLNPSVMPGFGYDPSGDVKSDPNTPANGIAYDAENRQTGYTKTGAGTTSYGYDGDGRRVKRTNPDNSAAIFVYNSGGQLIAEYTSGTPSGSGTSYLTSDHLGSTRVVTSAADGSGNVTVKARFDYLPFGEEIGSDRGSRSLVTGYVTSDKTRQKFTQKERDSESGLDYFGARYYSNAEGRFTSVDPGNYQARRTPNDPQSWNGYSYVNNNPLTRVDLDGRGFWEKFKNWIDGEGWRTNAEVEERYQALEDKWRNWLREREKEAGGNLIWCTGQGSCWKVEIDTLSRNGVFRYAATLKQSIEEGTVQHFSAEEVSRIAASTLNVPQRALETLQQIESTGRQNPPNGYRGNGPFDNDGRNGGQVLPKTDASGNTITYKEWDVNPYQKGVNRGTERLVTGTDGSAYYSNDHYLTFVKVK